MQSISWIEIAQKQISGNLPFLMQSNSPLFRPRKTDIKKPAPHPVDIIGNNYWMALSVFSVETVQTCSLHARSFKNLTQIV